MTSEQVTGLFRGLERQLAALGAVATARAMEHPDTSFTHYRKLGEASGLHTAWRMVADLADQIQEND